MRSSTINSGFEAQSTGCAAPSPPRANPPAVGAGADDVAAADGAAHRRVEGTEERPVPGRGRRGHSMLVNAAQLAIRAASSRQLAITTSDMNKAWEASAAAGALLMLERAQEDLRKLAAPPGL